jgi:threonine dehydrogenase-like Zn-dependent dehydrogenase
MSETGRAALFFAAGRPMELTEFPVPDPEPGGIVVRVSRANICGSDLHIWRGDGGLARMATEHGFIAGHEMIGRVHKLGAGVTTDWAGAPLAEGDRVVYQYFGPCGRCRACLRCQPEACPRSMDVMRGRPQDPPHFRGAYADYAYVSARQAVFKVPDAVTDIMAAGVNCALAQVVHGFERIDAGFGDQVVVQGAGGLGLYATAVAREHGAGRVIVIDGIADRLKLAQAMGAHDVIDLTEHDTPKARVQRVRELTEGWGADVACELVGFAGVIPEGLDMLGNGGRYLEIGTFYRGTTVPIDPGTLISRNIRIEAVYQYSAASLKAAVDFLERNVGRLPLDQVVSDYTLDDINKAFEDQANGLVARASIVME